MCEFLRVTITTYLRGGVKEWVETSTKKMGALLPEIVGRIMAAGPILIEWERERKEEARKREEEEKRRQERRRLQQRDENRWRQFARSPRIGKSARSYWPFLPRSKPAFMSKRTRQSPNKN